MKKKFQSDLFSPLGRWTRNYFLIKGGLKSGAILQKTFPVQSVAMIFFAGVGVGVGVGSCLLAHIFSARRSSRKIFFLGWPGPSQLSLRDSFFFLIIILISLSYNCALSLPAAWFLTPLRGPSTGPGRQ